MTPLIVEVRGEPQRCRAWLEALVAMAGAGGLGRPTTTNPLIGQPNLDVMAAGCRLTLPLADPAVVSLPAIRALFEPTAAGGPVPPALSRLEGPVGTEEVSELFRRMGQWRTSARVEAPALWPLGEPWTLSVEYDVSLDAPQKDRIVQLLTAFERLVADAPFLACPPGRFRAMGSSRIDWTQARALVYSVEGVASDAPWPEILCHALLAGVLAPAASRLVLLR